MDKALKVINEMARLRIVKGYAIGGGIAATYYTEPVLTYTEAKVVTAEYLTAIALQTGRAKDRERVIRLLEGGAVDRAVLKKILQKHKLAYKLKKLEGDRREK